MKWLLFIWTTFAALFFYGNVVQAGKSIRTLTLDDSGVGVIHTALGYSTILQFDSRPTSAVTGDQDAFKIEYVGQSLTIKPVVAIAKTNLFVFTDYERYSFQLVGGSAANVDYVVKVQRKGSKSFQVNTPGGEVPEPDDAEIRDINRAIHKKYQCGNISLIMDSFSWLASGKGILAKFGIAFQSQPRRDLQFQAGDFDFKQKGRSLPIENMYLSGVSLSRESPSVQGIALIKMQSIKKSLPLELIFSPDELKKTKCKTFAVQVPPGQLSPPRK